jgi:hypothetical protein
MPPSKLNTLDISSNVRARRAIVFSAWAVGALAVFLAFSSLGMVIANLGTDYRWIDLILMVILCAVLAAAVLSPAVAAARGIKWGVAVIAAIELLPVRLTPS